MTGASRSRTATRGSWRGRPTQALPGPRARWTQRIVFSVLALALLGLFTRLIIWWIFLPTVHFAYLPVVDYDVLAAPPIRYIEEDVREFAESAPHRAAVPLRDLQTSEAMPTLSKRLQGVLTGRKDTLVLYVLAHGVSIGGKPYVLSSDYRRETLAGRYPLADLLAQLRDSPADLKLLVLDAGQVSYDPASGVLVNQFARLAEKEVARVEDPTLWVLLSNRPFETSRVSQAGRRSVFGHCVSEALRGEADRDGDRKVDLAELADYARARVEGWARRETAGASGQAPWLLGAGRGAVDAPPPLVLVPVRPRAAMSDDESAEGAGPAQGVAGAEKGASKTAAQGQAGADELRRLLDEGWAARDALDARTDPGAWTPADYAPHLWREYQAMLLGYEERWSAGEAFDAKKLAQDLRAELALLPVLLRDQPMPAAADRATVLGRLAQARTLFVEGSVAAGYAEPSPLRDAVRDAVRLQDDLAFRAAYYVRWHALASANSSQPLALYASIRELLATALPALGEALESFGGDSPSRPRSSAELQSRLDDLRQRAEAVTRLRDRIEAEGLQREAKELTAEATATPRTKGIADRIDSLLAVPLLPAAIRSALRTARAGLDDPLELPSAAGGSLSAALPVAPWRRGRVAEQAGLELALVALADPDSAAGLHAQVASLQSQAGPAESSPGDRWWGDVDQLGAGLGGFYEGLPDRIAQSARGADGVMSRRVAGWLRLVDPRDARRVVEDAVALAVPPLPQPPAPEPTLAVAGPEAVRLDRRDWSPVEWTLRADGSAAGPCVVGLKFDASLVEIESGAEHRPVLPDQVLKLTLQPGQPQAVAFRVRPRSQDVPETTVSISVAGGGRSASRAATLRLPPPDVVELMVRGTGATVDRATGDASRIRLQPFPNRPTDYRFELVNRSGRKRVVRVELWGTPPAGPAGPRTLESPLDALGNVRPGFVRLQAALDVQVPADGTPVAIPFPEPKPAEKPAPGGTAPEAAEKPAQPAAPAPDARPVVTHGLLCTMTDAEDPSRRFTTRIDFAPLAPKMYLEPDVGYDPVQQRLLVRVKPRDADGDGQPDLDLLPPSAADKPIQIAWDTAGILDPGTEMKDQAELVAPQFAGTLFAKIESAAGKQVPVRLSVDGYPRAFVYLVRCDRARQSVERERSMCAVRIASPREGDAFRSPAESVPVELHVDAPEDAFQTPGDVVDVGIDEDGDGTLRQEAKQQLSADRQVTVRLDRMVPGGAVRVSAEVGDFKLALPASGLKNKKVRILAFLTVGSSSGGKENRTAEDGVGIVLDGAPPAVQIESPSRPVVAGEDVVFSATVDDLGGVAKMEVGLDLNGNGVLDDADKPKTLLGPGTGGVWTVVIPAKELPQGQYDLIVRATDRVGLVQTETKLVRILAPKPGMGPKPPAKTATIQGRVVLIDRPISGIEVTIEGLNRVAKSDENGRYIFRDVPHGSYKLSAKGTALNRFREGTATVTLPGPADPVIADIPLK